MQLACSRHCPQPACSRRAAAKASRGPQATTSADSSSSSSKHSSYGTKGLKQQQQQHQELQLLEPVPISYLLPRQAVALFAAGAALGPFCDGLHSQHNVLHYEHPTVSLHLEGLAWSFETCWWVPLLFGVAGLILGVSVPLLDEVAAGRAAAAGQPTTPAGSSQQPPPVAAAPTPAAATAAAPAAAAAPVKMGACEPSWAWVMLCISLFVVQYGLSGVLEQPLLGQTLGSSPVPALDAVLCAYALVHWAVFDRSRQGLAMSVLTALCGPAIEVALIRMGGLYHYTHPVWFGAVPTWIPWVYFCGGPAVGNLGRIVWQTLKCQGSREAASQHQQEAG